MNVQTHGLSGEPFTAATVGAAGAQDADAVCECSREDGVALVIDDHSCVRALVAWVLTDVGLQVREAATGDAGVAEAHVSQPEIVCVDLDMPGGGLAVLGRLRDALPTATVIAMTDSPRASLRDAVWAEGGDDMLEKPFHPDELRRAVAAARLHARLRMASQDLGATFVDSL